MHDLTPRQEDSKPSGAVAWCCRGCLQYRGLVLLAFLVTGAWGVLVSPFDWTLPVTRYPVPVDAIPDIGENQQIVFTGWPGRSPRDVEDQVTYPLTTALLGLPEVRTVRSFSYFGFSSISVIFHDGADFYWTRSRILEKLASLPPQTLPADAVPTLGPDATAIGQVFWYTLEGRDASGVPVGGWDLQELRRVQDFQVRYALQGVEGVAEVASIGGHVMEIQIDLDPDRMRVLGIDLPQVVNAVRMSNRDVGARTLEINRVEYLIRSTGLLETLEDVAAIAMRVEGNTPVRLGQIADIQRGPAPRRGVLDKEGVEAVGGVVVVRHGANPMATLKRVRARLAELAPSLPERHLEDGTRSRITVVPFYDRSELIHETLETLESAITDEILVTLVVILLVLLHLRSSLLVALLLPMAILLTFIAMKGLGVDANIVALSGIAIAIGTVVDMGIVMTENMLRHLEKLPGDSQDAAARLRAIHQAASEVGGAVLTAVLTTIVAFLPVFVMEGAEGKLFRPLAFTKTFVLLSSIFVALTLLPVLASLMLRGRVSPGTPRRPGLGHIPHIVVVAIAVFLLARTWQPIGPSSPVANLLFVVAVPGSVLLFFLFFLRVYPRLLAWILDHKVVLLLLVTVEIGLGIAAWRSLGEEFMPPLDEGAFLFMPTTMPHASVEEAHDILRHQNRAIRAIPEVREVVGKIGRVDSPLDPAPISMIETVIQIHPEYETGPDGLQRRRWRDEILRADDIWQDILAVSRLPGTTSAPRLQPISARLVMLQTGMRAPLGLKVLGPDLQGIEAAGQALEKVLREVPGVDPGTVFADRMVAKPYLELDIDREAIARYGLHIDQVQEAIQVAAGGRVVSTFVDGRERYGVRVRYARDRRDRIERLKQILVSTPGGGQVPLDQLIQDRTTRGPMVIKSEDTFLVGYVIFDKREGVSEGEVVKAAAERLDDARQSGGLVLPTGVRYQFAGSWENQIRAKETLALILPLSLVLIFILLRLQMRRLSTALLVFSGVFVAACGGFLLLWCYGQPWFLNVEVAGVSLRELFHVGPVNLSVAVWVGFLALFGIATDDGVLMGTYLEQRFEDTPPRTRQEVRQATVEAATRRNRAAVMTTATTLLSLLPILTSSGRGADIMIPMAIPTLGGEALTILTVFVVPTCFCWLAERRLSRGQAVSQS